LKLSLIAIAQNPNSIGFHLSLLTKRDYTVA